MYRDGRIVHGRGEREIAVPEATALGEQHRATLEVEPLDTNMLSLGGGFVDEHGVTLAHRVLLDHDCVGAGRQDSASEDACGFPAPDRALEGMSSGDFADDLQADRCAGHVL